MTGDRTFSLQPGTCTLLSGGDGCTVSITIQSGSGGKASKDAPIEASMQGMDVVACEGDEPIEVPVIVDVRGMSSGQALPGARF